MNIEEIREEVEVHLNPIIKFEGYELIELSLLPRRGRLLLRFLINRPGGITMAECAELNRKISRVLDGLEFIPQSYILEVSSPGLDRVLKEEKEFRCVIGRELSIVRKDGSKIRGSLLKVGDGRIQVLAQEQVIDIPISEIEGARQMIDPALFGRKFNSERKGKTDKATLSREDGETRLGDKWLRS